MKVYIVCGGTINHVAPHLALSAQAKGSVGLKIYQNLTKTKWSINWPESAVKGGEKENPNKGVEFVLVPTTMAFYECRDNISDEYLELLKSAGLKKLETHKHVKKLLKFLTNQEDTKGIVLPAAICDYKARIIKKISPNKMTLSQVVEFNPGKKAKRLKTSEGNLSIEITPTEKLVHSIRRKRKDIFLVSFKTMAGESVERNYKTGLESLKKNKSNLVFINDIKNKYNMIMTPEEFVYGFKDRNDAVIELSEMIWNRLNLSYHQTIVKGRERANLRQLEKDGNIPSNFNKVLSHLISSKAYKPFQVIDERKSGPSKFKQITVGHFGCKVTGIDNFYRLSSVRTSNHNNVMTNGAIEIIAEEGKTITVSGGKPSVGEHTQRAMYDKLGAKADSIVHFHCPLKEGVTNIPVRLQKPYQCGTDECAMNTRYGLGEVAPGIYAVHLEGHGPNIAFSKDVPADDVTKFIDAHWDLSKKEDGLEGVKNLLEDN